MLLISGNIFQEMHRNVTEKHSPVVLVWVKIQLHFKRLLRIPTQLPKPTQIWTPKIVVEGRAEKEGGIGEGILMNTRPLGTFG